MNVRTAAIIGSFKQHYESVLVAWKTLTDMGLEITSPKGASIIEEGIPFVRFTSDPAHEDDATVQTIALHRILRADWVYVVAPMGYVGRTTCYEIGRIVQAVRPIYFSEQPMDLPIHVPNAHIVRIPELLSRIGKPDFVPRPLYTDPGDEKALLEQDLLMGRYRADEEI